MKILYVAYKYEYGNPKLGFSSTHYIFYDTLIKMNKGSNKVSYFPIDEIIKAVGREEMNKNLLAAVFKEKPDLVFFVNGGKTIKKEIIKEITQESGAVTLNLFFDDHWKFYNYSRYWGPLYHWVGTTDPLVIKKYNKIGYKNAIFTPVACNQFLYKPLKLPKIHDVSFIGVPHGNRKKIIKKLEKAGIDVKCWGHGWPQGRVSQEEMSKIFSQSKINLNFSKSSGILWKQIGLIFLHRKFDRSIGINNPLKWYENLQVLLAQRRRQLKGRNFDVPGCGGFLLTEYIEKLEDLYEIGKEIDCFFNFNGLVKKIKYYLEHDEERERIAKAGYERTLRDHTSEKRLNEIFRIIGLTK